MGTTPGDELEQIRTLVGQSITRHQIPDSTVEIVANALHAAACPHWATEDPSALPFYRTLAIVALAAAWSPVAAQALLAAAEDYSVAYRVASGAAMQEAYDFLHDRAVCISRGEIPR